MKLVKTNKFYIYFILLKEYEKVYYENFDDFDELGFLFYGDNLEYNTLEILIKNLVKDVNFFNNQLFNNFL